MRVAKWAWVVLIASGVTGCTRTKIVYVDRATTTTESTTPTTASWATTTTTAAPTTTAPPTVPVTRAPTAVTTAPATAPQRARAWTTVSTLVGAGNKQGPDFQIGGGQLRATWQSTDGATFYLAEASKSYGEQFGSCADGKPCSDTGYPHAGAGNYYIKVIALDRAQWSVTLEELR